MVRLPISIFVFAAAVTAAPVAEQNNQIDADITKGGLDNSGSGITQGVHGHDERPESDFLSGPLAPKVSGGKMSDALQNDLIVRQDDPWGYDGKYPGTVPESCGYELLAGSTDAPLMEDCRLARDELVGLAVPRNLPQWHLKNSCVVGWHPPDNTPEGDLLEDKDGLSRAFDVLFTKCPTGATGEFVSNYAFYTIQDEGNLLGGVVSAFVAGAPLDENPPPPPA